MQFGKLIEGKLIFAGKTITLNGTVITNPTNQQLLLAGYKQVVYDPQPEYDREEEKLAEVYTEGENITVSYTKVALTDVEHNNVIKQEIEEEEFKITDRNIRNAIQGDSFALNKINEVETAIQALRSKLR